MASRWRIRHKLLLGQGLVVVVMALLLAGTSRGLYSYYLTTNSIRARLAELGAAEELKSAIFELVADENAANLVRQQHLIPGEIKKVREHLATCTQSFEDVTPGMADPRELYLLGFLEQLSRDLDAFRTAVEACGKSGFGTVSDEVRKKEHLRALAEPMNNLRRNVVDLRHSINKELNDRLNESRPHYQRTLKIIIPASIVGLLVMAGLMRSFYVWLFTPIRDLANGVSRVAQGDLQHRIDLHSGDEMEDLGRAFNDMLGRLCELYADLAQQVNIRSKQLVRSERLASVGFLAAGVAHEINNPLASIAFCGEALQARLKSLLAQAPSKEGKNTEEFEVFNKYLDMIQEEAFRCKRITERLLQFSRTGEPRRESTDLRDLVQAVLDVTQHLPSYKDKRIIFEVPPDRAGRITAWVNGEEIKSVILNLVVNALESMDEGGMLSIRLGQREGFAELRFTDTGCGMSREVLENIFEPFFTRSRSGKGTGLGLTISHLIISQHGGEIEASSPGPGQGSTFSVRLQTQPQEPANNLPIAPRQLAGQAA